MAAAKTAADNFAAMGGFGIFLELMEFDHKLICYELTMLRIDQSDNCKFVTLSHNCSLLSHLCQAFPCSSFC